MNAARAIVRDRLAGTILLDALENAGVEVDALRAGLILSRHDLRQGRDPMLRLNAARARLNELRRLLDEAAAQYEEGR